MKTQSQQKSALRIASTVMAATGFLVGSAQAGTQNQTNNPFGYQEVNPGSFKVAGRHEGQCGEGQCGGTKKAGEGQCGEGQCGGNKKAGEGRCGEGQCGGAMKKKHKGKMHMKMREMEKKIDKMMMMMEKMEKKMK